MEKSKYYDSHEGTPQGGIISPVLSNLFMHYVFDKWMERTFPGTPFCQYADDGLAHCHSEADAIRVKTELAARLQECGLEMHPEKTKIVYCKDEDRKGEYPVTSFDFLGYTKVRGEANPYDSAYREYFKDRAEKQCRTRNYDRLFLASTSLERTLIRG